MKVKVIRKKALWRDPVEEEFLLIKVYGTYGECDAIQTATIQKVAELLPKTDSWRPKIIDLGKVREGKDD